MFYKRTLRKLTAFSLATLLTTQLFPVSSYNSTTEQASCPVIHAEEIGTISTFSDLATAAATGGTYVLTNSVVIPSYLDIPKGVHLTLLQEKDATNKITTGEKGRLFNVAKGATLTLGSDDTDPLILDGANCADYYSIIASNGLVQIYNADITAPNGYAITSTNIEMTGGRIHDCKYQGLTVGMNGKAHISGGTIENSRCAVNIAHVTASATISGGNFVQNETAVRSSGNCVITGGLFSLCDYGFQSNSNGTITFSGGILSDITYWALDLSYGGNIYFNGGMIKNSKSTTYPSYNGNDIWNTTTNSTSRIYLSGSPYMDENSFIYCRSGNPVYQSGSLTAPADHPDAKLQIAAHSNLTKAVVAASGSGVSLADSLSLYKPFDDSYSFYVDGDRIYATGEAPEAVFPTVRPLPSDANTEPVATLPAASAVPALPTLPPLPTLPVPDTKPPVSTAAPTLTPAVTQTTVTTTSAGISGTNNTLPVTNYDLFTNTAPSITKLSAKALQFKLNWTFDCIISPDRYNIYYSVDGKNFTLLKSVAGSIQNASLSLPSAYDGRKIYFYVQAQVSENGNVYLTKPSSIASGYLIPKVTKTSNSFLTQSKKMLVKWKKVSNCTGYAVYLRATCNGKTTTKQCVTVSKKKNKAMISEKKIRTLFQRKGKPIRIKKCYVRAFYKIGKKIAYSPK